MNLNSLRFTLTLLTFSLFSTISLSQVVDWMSPDAYGTYGITVDEFDNSYTVGQYVNTIVINGVSYTSEGLQDEIIVKYDANGNVLWATSIGGTQSDWAGEIVYDGLGNVWVTGQFSGTLNAGAFSVLTNGSEDAYLVKLDAATGTPLYASNGGGSSANDDGNSIAADGFGNIYVIGDAASSNFTWGGLSMSASGSNDVFIIKFDNLGNPLWLSKCTGSSADFTYAGAADPAGNVYVCGLTLSATLSVNGNAIATGTNNHFVTKFDTNGNEVWTNLFEGGGNPYDMCVDDWGNVYFTLAAGPSTYGPIVITTSNGGSDATLGKINANGTWAWVQQYGGTGSDEGLGVDCDAEGNIFWTGYFEGSMTMGTFNLSSNSQKKAFFAKLDSTGSVIWALNSKGGVGSHYTYGVDATSGDDVWFSGFGSDHIVIANDSMGLSLGYAVRIADSANVIKGIVYADASNDGILDAGENGIPNVMIQLDANNFVVSTNNSGEYSMYTLPGAYTVSIPYPPLYHTFTTPTTQSANFAGMGACDSLNHFGLYPTPNKNDLRIDITPTTNPKAGHVLGYILTYKNVGTTVQTGNVSITADANLSFVMASPTVGSQNGQTATWNVGTLNPGDVGNIFIYYNIPAGMQIGDPLTSTCIIDPTTGDETPGDNADNTTSLVTGPYDPNYKSVDQEVLYDISGSSYLEYEIHFQNLGNAPAQDVLIIDTLASSYLEMASMEIITSSHSPMNLSISNGNVAKFNFPGIMLPDSTSDPLGSMGMVKFRIKQNGTLPLGQTIDNFGDIYFDFNPAIRTNTASTLHATGAGIKEELVSAIHVYPNPSTGVVNIISINQDELTAVSVIDLSGRLVYTAPLAGVAEQIDISALKSGVYILQLTTSTGVVKTIVEKH